MMVMELVLVPLVVAELGFLALMWLKNLVLSSTTLVLVTLPVGTPNQNDRLGNPI